jgi:hypothetical protein
MKPFLWQDIYLHGVLGFMNVMLHLTKVVSEFKIRVRKVTFLLYRIRGVFKKRPNFLDRAPTSTESALWLLSVPRVKF